jgi:hypothetical protein
MGKISKAQKEHNLKISERAKSRNLETLQNNSILIIYADSYVCKLYPLKHFILMFHLQF